MRHNWVNLSLCEIAKQAKSKWMCPIQVIVQWTTQISYKSLLVYNTYYLRTLSEPCHNYLHQHMIARQTVSSIHPLIIHMAIHDVPHRPCPGPGPWPFPWSRGTKHLEAICPVSPSLRPLSLATSHNKSFLHGGGQGANCKRSAPKNDDASTHSSVALHSVVTPGVTVVKLESTPIYIGNIHTGFQLRGFGEPSLLPLIHNI